jgi:hypothetical protein
VTTSPGGDAMTVSFRREADLARLKRAKVPRPIAWTLHPADVAECAVRGEHCHVRRCSNAAVVVTWRWWRSAEVARILLAEHVVCTEHGQEFAGRHHIQIEPARDRPRVSAGHVFPGDLLAEFLERGEETGPRARLEVMTTGQIGICTATGSHCGFQRCLAPVRYLSSLRYTTRSGREHQRGRLLCEEHAARFASRHSIDLAAASLPPGGAS